MACRVLGGPILWTLTIDDEFEREYKITHLVKGVKGIDGPYNASRAVGLPTVGSLWLFGGDLDPWGFCRPGKVVNVHEGKQGEIDEWFTVEQRFSTKALKKCQEDEITDPLLKPPKISGDSSSDKEEAMYDRHGNPIVNSAHEQIRGPQNEWDVNRRQVTIEQNTVDLERTLIEPMENTLNDRPLWGYPARSVRLSKIRWQENYYGSCYKYYTRTLVFDVKVRRLNVFNPFPLPGGAFLPGPLGTFIVGDWDRDLLDEGTKVLYGRWDGTVGTGQQITITSVDADGGILTAVLAGTDTGYPKNAIVPLYVDLPVAGVGRVAVVLVQTDATGTVTSLVRIHLPGSSYGISVSNTTQRGNWVLATLWGFTPSQDNPQYFMRSVDAKGNQMRLLLDGKGMPIGPDEEPGGIHVEKYDTSNFLLLGIPDLPD